MKKKKQNITITEEQHNKLATLIIGLLAIGFVFGSYFIIDIFTNEPRQTEIKVEWQCGDRNNGVIYSNRDVAINCK